MRNIFRYLKKGVYNISTLIYYLLSGENVHWDYISDVKINCKINGHARVMGPCSLNNVSVDFGTYIATHSNISYTVIGKFCSLGPNLLCGWGIHPTHGISTSPIFYSTRMQCNFTLSSEDKVIERKPINIGNDVFIGANVTVLDGITIGDGAVIGAGALVNKDIPPYAIAVGCPIQIVKYRFDEKKIAELLKIKWWDKNIEELLMVEKFFFDVEEFIRISK